MPKKKMLAELPANTEKNTVKNAFILKISVIKARDRMSEVKLCTVRRIFQNVKSS